MAQDHFSAQAGDYAKFRPGYPEALFDWLGTLTQDHDLVWDCGCGNGQASLPLAERYARIVATDLSAQQIANATPHERISYRVAPAESSGLADASVDLLTVAQALHWFDFDAFYAEARRVLKPGGVIAAWTYQLLQSEPEINAALADFYTRTLGPYWPPERRWVDLAYQGMPFPFTALPAPNYVIELHWLLDDLIAYLGTWSATQRYRATTGLDPLPAFREQLQALWGDRVRKIIWPIATRVGRV